MKQDHRDQFYHKLNEQKKPRFTGQRAMLLTFGGLGGIYAVIGGGLLAFLLYARMTGLNILSLGEEADVALPILAGVFAVLGVIFLLVTLLLWRADRRKRRQLEELRTWGQQVTGTVTSVRRDWRIRVNHLSPMIAQVECPFPRGTVTLKSPWLWQIEPAVGQQVTVYFDPMDESKYAMDIPDA